MLLCSASTACEALHVTAPLPESALNIGPAAVMSAEHGLTVLPGPSGCRIAQGCCDKGQRPQGSFGTENTFYRVTNHWVMVHPGGFI